MNTKDGPRASNPGGIRTGEPTTCRCGREMVCLFSEPIYGRAGTGERIAVGYRYHYRCDGCRRECDVRWGERNVAAEPRAESREPRPA